MRESPEVTLSLDILKHGKRFHATVSFDTDTGNYTSVATFLTSIRTVLFSLDSLSLGIVMTFLCIFSKDSSKRSLK